MFYLKWKEVREAFPKQWVLIEVVDAFTNDKRERILEDVIPINKFSSSPEAMKAYKELHGKDPFREYYVLHTNREKPNILEKRLVGVRRF